VYWHWSYACHWELANDDLRKKWQESITDLKTKTTGFKDNISIFSHDLFD